MRVISFETVPFDPSDRSDHYARNIRHPYVVRAFVIEDGVTVGAYEAVRRSKRQAKAAIMNIFDL